MKKTTSTKKALFLAALSTLLCVSMLIGTTFAWFTDTASTAVNKIVSGNLNVALEMKDADGKWVSAEGKTLNFKAADGNTEILWEPGCTYELPELRVVNKGSLALKYKIAVSGLNGNAKLMEVIEWYYNDAAIATDTGMIVSEDVTLNANEEGASFVLKAHMEETAGNEYQNLSVEGIAITVYATQATVESDSNGNDYDADAEYAYVNNEAELIAALNAGKNVIFNSEIALTEQLVISKDATINGNGNALISGKPVRVAPEANVTITNVNFTNPVNNSASYGGKDVGSNLYAGTNGVRYSGKLVLNGCTFSGMKWDGVQILPAQGAEIVINNCTFELNEAAPAGNSTRFIHIEAEQNSNANVKVTLTNNTFGATDYINNALIDIDYINIAGIDFGGNNIYADTDADIYVCGASVDRTISKDDAYKALGKKLVVAGTQDDLNAAIGAAGTAPTEVKLAEGTYTLPTLEGKTITVTGTKDTVVNMKNQVNKASSASFNGVTVEFANESYKGFQHTGKLVYENCTIKGLQFLYADEVEFINCTFEQDQDDAYHIWTYGAKNVTFTGCHFKSTAKSKAVLCYTEASGTTFTRTFNNCTFEATGAAGKSAIMINPTAYSGVNTYVININNCTADGYAENGITGTTLVGVKETVKDNITVKINGTTVYTHTAG